VSSWSNRFAEAAGLGLTVLLAACHSAPPKHAPLPPTRVVGGTSASGTGAAPASGGNTAPGRAAAPSSGAARAGAEASAAAPAADNTPIPPRAAEQYTAALNLMRAHRDTDAELELKELALTYPQFAGPQINLGLLYLRTNRFADAEQAFRSALTRNPQSAVASDELGIALRKLGKFTEAEAAYQRTISLDPNYAPAYLNLGVLYDLYLAEPQKALEQFEHYLQLAGENKQVSGWVIELRKRVGAPPTPKKEPA